MRPGEPEIIRNLAWAFHGAGRDADAVRTFEHLAKIESPTADDQYRLGVSLEKVGRVDDVLVPGAPAPAPTPIDSTPTSPLRQPRGSPGASLEALASSRRSRAWLPIAWRASATSAPPSQALGLHPDAVSAFREAIKRAPRSPCCAWAWRSVRRRGLHAGGRRGAGAGGADRWRLRPGC
nr:hypothetical protein [Deltaproteobacteria bacterium]